MMYGNEDEIIKKIIIKFNEKGRKTCQ